MKRRLFLLGEGGVLFCGERRRSALNLQCAEDGTDEHDKHGQGGHEIPKSQKITGQQHVRANSEKTNRGKGYGRKYNADKYFDGGPGKVALQAFFGIKGSRQKEYPGANFWIVNQNKLGVAHLVVFDKIIKIRPVMRPTRCNTQKIDARGHIHQIQRCYSSGEGRHGQAQRQFKGNRRNADGGAAGQSSMRHNVQH